MYLSKKMARIQRGLIIYETSDRDFIYVCDKRSVAFTSTNVFEEHVVSHHIEVTAVDAE